MERAGQWAARRAAVEHGENPFRTTEQPPSQPQLVQQPDLVYMPVVAVSEYTSSSTALTDSVTQHWCSDPPSMSSGSTSIFINGPITSTSPVSHPIEFATTTMYGESVGQYDQLQRVSISISDDYGITPAGSEDLRVSHHGHFSRFQDQPCETTTVLRQPRAQYYSELDQLPLSFNPPTSANNNLHRVQQQSDCLIPYPPSPIPQQDLGSFTGQFYPSTSQQLNSIHGSTLSHPKSSRYSPYPKQPAQPDAPQPTQEEPNAPVTGAKQRVRPAARRKDAKARLRLSADLPATTDPSIKPYACGYRSCWQSDASTSRACYSTSRGLSDHKKTEHSNGVGIKRPYRCGLEGCGKSWKASDWVMSISGLQYHLQISKTHFQPALIDMPYISGLSDPTSVEASRSGQSETRKKQYSCPHDNCPNRYKQLSGLRYHLAHGHPADLPAQLDLVPPLLSPQLVEMIQKQAQVEGGPSKHDRSLQQRDITAHSGTLEPEEAKTIVNPSREHPQ
ncbi:hypothetical protein SCLCIDRAFT_9470 [Scleroderma citrinum Foug A]|uniref:C2H2-type domain-containing protein n=1 Tax=Scleroderma citrinum Foug A TaxID=1036808 RepID=A0A0C3DKL4_9AGAM|nr:hypothetical protein SCLCIDRAFT_9470 [Scleroderma citrinum Foug A]